MKQILVQNLFYVNLLLTRSTFQELLSIQSETVKICALKMLKRVLPFTLKLYYFLNWLTVKSGTNLYNKSDVAHGAYGVIRGKVRYLREYVQVDSYICGVYDIILERPREDTVIATRSTELCYIPSEIIKAFKLWFPTVQTMLLKVIVTFNIKNHKLTTSYQKFTD